jgi:cold shock protein
MRQVTTSAPSGGSAMAAKAAHDAAVRVTGHVRWFSHKGFGYLATDGGRDIYVHHSAIVGSGFRTLPTDARVSFSIVQTRRGPEAVDVRIIDGEEVVDAGDAFRE